MEGIQQMFAEFMGYDELDTQLTIWAYHRQHVRHERYLDQRSRHPGDDYKRLKRWRLENPEKFREKQKRDSAKYRARYPEKVRERSRLQKQRYRERNREKVREWNRKNQAARRARLRSLSAPANADTGRDKTQKERVA